MSNKKTAGPAARDSAEWNNGWATLSKLATARQMALGDLVSPLPRPIACNGAVVSGVDELLAGPSKIDQLELATAISEIEQASAALRAAEPALDRTFHLAHA